MKKEEASRRYHNQIDSKQYIAKAQHQDSRRGAGTESSQKEGEMGSSLLWICLAYLANYISGGLTQVQNCELII